jgi:hypothetical protein
MRVLAFILGMLIFTTGCASNRPAPTAHQISLKQEEIKGLREQIVGITQVLDRISQGSFGAGTNVTEVQVRDLDHVIQVFQQTKSKLVTECNRLHDEYHWEGPY